jgi:alginate O-acetyltransferase complex protein AlgJ
LQNPSFEELRRRLDEAGIDYLDVTAALWQMGREKSEPLYLRSDTHWTPEAVEEAAQQLGEVLAERGLIRPESADRYIQRSHEVENLGDIARMLTPTPRQAEAWRQRVTLQRVVEATGRSWQSEPKAAILLLGDSFSNIYSDPGLGWGVGAGLAEQLSFFLQSPVDKIALNAGGALAARRALRRHLVSSTGRLDGKRVVIYQFAVRELMQGDWRLLGVD